MKSFIAVFLFMISSLGHSYVILIDPGHGGDEFGAVTKIKRKNSKGKTYYHKYYEKDLCLRLAKKLKAYLDPYYSVYLTRSIDRKVSLQNRAKMADTVKADIFISIHFNAAHDKRSNGFETFYLDNHKDKAIKKVEDIENKNLKGEDKIINQILIDLTIEKTVDSSKKLAKLVHKNLVKDIAKNFKIKNREIKPGLFYVLALSKRPGILIEGGFMTNSKEMKKINSNKYLDAYARSVSKGVIKFFDSLPKKELPLF